jgi:hypothetical protein
MRISCLAASLVLAFLIHTPPATADTRDDAQRVVQILINQSVVNAMIDAIEPLTRQALAQTLSKGENAQLTPGSRDVITTMFLNEFRNRFLGAMLNEYVQIYMAELSPDELAGLRAFLETPVGQSYGAKQTNLIRRGSQVGGRVGRDIGSLAARVIAQRLATDGQNLIANLADLETLRRTFPHRPR